MDSQEKTKRKATPQLEEISLSLDKSSSKNKRGTHSEELSLQIASENRDHINHDTMNKRDIVKKEKTEQKS